MTITKHKNNYPQITCPFLDIQSAHCARIHTHKINFFVYQSLTVYCESKRSTLQTKQILSELFMALIFAQRLHETTIFHFFLPIPLFLFVSKIHALSLSRPRSCFLQLHVSLLFFNFWYSIQDRQKKPRIDDSISFATMKILFSVYIDFRMLLFSVKIVD